MFGIIGVPAPENLTVDSVTAKSANLSWSLSCGTYQTPHSFLISYHSEGTEPQTISTDACSAVITGLKPHTEYTVSVSTENQHREKSQPASVSILTGEREITRVFVSQSKGNLLFGPTGRSYSDTDYTKHHTDIINPV